MEKKMTKKDYFNLVAEIVANADVENQDDIQAFISHEIELLEKKSSKSKPSKTQKENEGTMQEIVSVLATLDTPVTVTELMKADETMAVYSNQKLSALLKKLVDNGTVKKTVEKKKSYFFLVSEENTGEDEIDTNVEENIEE